MALYDEWLRTRKITEEYTTGQVCEQVVKPATAEKKLSYVNYVKDILKRTGEVANATEFVSHAWRYKYSSGQDARARPQAVSMILCFLLRASLSVSCLSTCSSRNHV